jgi:hypothetical protein
MEHFAGLATPHWWTVWKRLTLIGRLEKRTSPNSFVISVKCLKQTSGFHWITSSARAIRPARSAVDGRPPPGSNP